MPVVDGRLVCFSGHDLGFDAEDPYADPDCRTCNRLEMEAEAEEWEAQLQQRLVWYRDQGIADPVARILVELTDDLNDLRHTVSRLQPR